MKLKKGRNKVVIKTLKKTNLIQRNGGEERQEEYLTSVPSIPSSVWNRCRVLVLSLFFTIFMY